MTARRQRGGDRSRAVPSGRRAFDIAINAAIACCAVLVTLGVFEFVLFRSVLRAPDLPRLDFRDGIVKYEPNQHGINRVRDEITTPWQVNANGWPSSLAEYREAKPPGTYRIGVIGDSYIEGLSVRPAENVAEQLQKDLRDPSIEVYRFGIAGAPMSQYLHMLRREVCRYHPDLVVVNLVHNDFRESYAATAPGLGFQEGPYESSFLKLHVRERMVWEVEPHALQQPWYEALLAGSATWRYLAGRYQLRYRLFRTPSSRDEARRRAAASRAREIPRDADHLVTEYLVPRLRATAARCGARLALVIDGDRDAIYAGRTEQSALLRLNTIVQGVAEQQRVPFLDLHEVFRRDYLQHGLMFNFKSDRHWNPRGHAVAASAIKQFLVDRGLVADHHG